MNYYYLKGFLYENLIMNDFTKRKFNRGKNVILIIGRQEFFDEALHNESIGHIGGQLKFLPDSCLEYM